MPLMVRPCRYGIYDRCDLGIYRLDLSDNHLVGTLPSEIGLLSQFDALRLSSNNIYGTLPSELGASSCSAMARRDLTVYGAVH